MASAGERGYLLGTGVWIMTTKPWVPYVNTIKDKSIVPIAHYADPANRFDPFDPTNTITESGEWIWVDCGGGFSPAVPAEPYRVCPECETKRGPTSVLVMVDATWTSEEWEELERTWFNKRWEELVRNA